MLQPSNNSLTSKKGVGLGAAGSVGILHPIQRQKKVGPAEAGPIEGLEVMENHQRTGCS
jgi:hypothetical protein